MKEYFLQANMPHSNVNKGVQTIINETHVNRTFEPANDAFTSLREGGDWIFEMISNFIDQIFGNIW
jgi:hypothetical protein